MACNVDGPIVGSTTGRVERKHFYGQYNRGLRCHFCRCDRLKSCCYPGYKFTEPGPSFSTRSMGMNSRLDFYMRKGRVMTGCGKFCGICGVLTTCTKIEATKFTKRRFKSVLHEFGPRGKHVRRFHVGKAKMALGLTGGPTKFGRGVSTIVRSRTPGSVVVTVGSGTRSKASVS